MVAMVKLGLPIDPQAAVPVRPGNINAAVAGLPELVAVARGVGTPRAARPNVVVAPPGSKTKAADVHRPWQEATT